MVNTTIVPIIDSWLEAGRELGYESHDPNGFQREGNLSSVTGLTPLLRGCS